MTWIEDMRADALEIAAPGFALRPGDEVHIDVRHWDDAYLSSVTFEPGGFGVFVSVWRPTDEGLTGHGPGGEHVHGWNETGQHYYEPVQKSYAGQAAQEFLVALMKAGSRGTHEHEFRRAEDNWGQPQPGRHFEMCGCGRGRVAVRQPGGSFRYERPA